MISDSRRPGCTGRNHLTAPPKVTEHAGLNRTKPFVYLAPILAIWGFAACAQPHEEAAKATPGSPQIFAEGIVSTGAPEFASSFTPDGRTVYFNRTTPDRSSLVIMKSEQVDGVWQEPDTASFSGTWFDVDPFVAPDGSKLFISSTRPTSASDTLLDFNTWVVSLQDGSEGEPWPLPEPLNSDSTEVFASATLSGALYFSSDRDGVMRTVRASSMEPDARLTVVPIDLNVGAGVGNPAISPDEQYLVVVTRSDSGIGAADLFVSKRIGESWTPAHLLPEPINSTFTDFAPSWSPDGKYLYFTSERPGVAGPVAEGVRPPGDIYRVEASAIVGM